MTSFIQSISRHPLTGFSFAPLSNAGSGKAATGTRQDAGDTEYHLVFATTTASLIAASAVVFAALSHTI